MTSFNEFDLADMPQRYRANFINSLSGFKSANLIGTQTANGVFNLAVFNSVFHLGANPPLLGMVFRPHTVRRDTLENILETQHYTINHIHKNMIKQAHQTSAKYDKDISEFTAVGLTPEIHGAFPAPYVQESKIKIGLQMREVLPVKSNDTQIMVGEIKEIHLAQQLLSPDGHVELDQAEGIAISGLDTYHLPQLLARFDYATPT